MRGGTIYREVEFGGSYQRGSVTLIDLDCCGHCNGTLEATFYLPVGVIVLSSSQRHSGGGGAGVRISHRINNRLM